MGCRIALLFPSDDSALLDLRDNANFVGNLQTKMNTRIKGYVCGVLAAATYGMNPLFALPLYGEGMDANSVLFWRYLTALPILWLMLRMRGRNLFISRSEIVPLVSLGLMLGLSSFGLFESYNHMDAGIASTLLFVYPLMVALIMSALYHERMTVQTIVCLVVALAGIWLLGHGGDGSAFSVMGIFWVAVSALSYAVYIVAVNRIPSMHSVPTLKLTFYVILFGLSIFVAKALATGDLSMPASVAGWGDVLALAALPTALSLSLTTVAIQYIGSTPTAILGVFEPVTAVFFGLTVFGETLTGRQGIGLVLVLTAVSVVIAGDTITRHIVRLRKMFPPLGRH